MNSSPRFEFLDSRAERYNEIAVRVSRDMNYERRDRRGHCGRKQDISVCNCSRGNGSAEKRRKNSERGESDVIEKADKVERRSVGVDSLSV